MKQNVPIKIAMFPSESSLDGSGDLHPVYEIQREGGRVQLLPVSVGTLRRGTPLRSPQTRYVSWFV